MAAILSRTKRANLLSYAPCDISVIRYGWNIIEYAMDV